MSKTIAIPQYNLKQILFMFAWPIVWFSVLIYFMGTLFVEDGVLPTWVVLVVWTLGNGLEMAVAILVLKKEGTINSWATLKERIHLHWPNKSLKTWLKIIAIFFIGFIVASFIAEFNESIAGLMPPPEWLPSNPLKPSPASIQEAYHGITLEGNYGFLIYRFVFLGFILNMVGEELYYRSVLLPKMKGVFGKFDCVANGTLFAVKHLYYFWRVPFLIPAGIAFALIFKVGGLPIAVITHWLGNMEILELIEAIKAVF